MLIARALVAVAGLALLASIVWAGAVMGSNLFAEGSQILDLPWGVVTLLDLYVGFVIIAVVIFVVEPNKWVALAWVAPLPFLGNIVAALWAVLRLPALARRLR